MKNRWRHALCHAARDQGKTAFYLGLRNLPPGALDSLEGLDKLDLVCVDDLQAVAGKAQWEEALFHFTNRLRASTGALAMASRVRLSSLEFGLPDLASRVAWGLRLELAPLEDPDKVRVIQCHAASLGIELPDEVVNYLIKRGHRSLARLVGSVERLQHAAFTAKRRITVPLAREVLNQQ